MQSWNWAAVKKSFNLLSKPELIIPRLAVNNLSEINWVELGEKYEIQAICFDKDNTLTAPYKNNLHPSVISHVEKCKSVFDKIAVFSNSVGSSSYDVGFKKALEFETNTDIFVIKHNFKKPEGSESIINHFSNLRPNQIAFIGDRLLTDVVMANESGMFSIYLKKELTTEGDNFLAVCFRYLEQHFLYKNKT